MTDLERFYSKTRRNSTTGCLEWTASKNSDGYGNFRYPGSRQGKTVGAHRWVFGQVHDFLPQVVMHSCDNPACVEISHLRAGTVASNNADKERKGRANHPRGEAHGRRKLSDAECKEIRAEYAKGVLTYQMLGDVYGVSDVQIGNIIRKRQRS